MEHIVKRTLDGIGYVFPKKIWDNYFMNMIITSKDENSCDVSLYGVDGVFTIPMTVQEAVDSINNDGELLVNELFKSKDFPKSKFLSIRPQKY